MGSVQDLLQELGALRAKSSRRDREQQTTGRTVQQTVEHIAEAIRRGESTGDRLYDLCFLKYGSFAIGVWDRLSQLRQQLKEHDGQLVLLIERDYTCVKHVMIPHGDQQNEYAVRVVYQAGVICEPYLHLIHPGGGDVPEPAD